MSPPKMKATRIATSEYGHPKEGFTQAYKVEGNGTLVFLSGITARSATAKVLHLGDIEAQTRTVFDNIVNVLKASGATLADVVKTNAYVTHADYMEVYRSVKEDYFGKGGPPGTVVQVVALYDPRQLIEIEAIAVIPKE